MSGSDHTTSSSRRSPRRRSLNGPGPETQRWMPALADAAVDDDLEVVAAGEAAA